jgi:tungstate transport system ATP-binding protein
VRLLAVRGLRVERLGKQVLVVDALDLAQGETLAVIGPNGAGKSTLLLALAKLIMVSAGQITFQGQPLERLDDLAYRRKIALVLQEPLLLDGSVFDNVAAPLRFRGLPRQEVQLRVETWVERLGIASLLHRQTRRLSGGEAQRVSLARALALQPDLLLLDEPFSALDAPTRARLLADLHALLNASSVTAIFVTHDQDEAMLLGERVAVILAGRLRQVDTPSKIFNAPADEEVAAFVGVETVLPGVVSASQEQQVTLSVAGLPVYAVGQVQGGQPVLVCLRPEDITLWRDGLLPPSSARNRLRGIISGLTPSGPLVRVVVSLADCNEPTSLVALITRHSAQEMGLESGVVVTATFKASAVHLIAR